MRRIIGVLGLVLAVAIPGAVATGPSPAAHADPLPFVVRPGVHQLAVLGAEPGAGLELRRDGVPVGTGTVDAQGSFLWRGLDAGAGYRVVATLAGGPVTSNRARVLAPDDAPDQSFYDSQVLADGFGYITTRDGTTLSANVRLPGPIDEGPYPTVVEYSGYDPSNPYSPQPSTIVAGLLGYAVVGVNMRGTGCSGGSFQYFEEVQSIDGYDVIETVAAQPWVLHGKVGMVGLSYPGISQLFVAATQPPHLAAITPLSPIADTYRSTLGPGGIRNIGFARDWAIARQRESEPYGQGWSRRLVDEGGPGAAECAENQRVRLQNPDQVALIDANEFYDPALLDGLAPINFVDRIRVPVLLGNAWQDEQVGPQSAELLSHFTRSPDVHAVLVNGLHPDPWLAALQPWSEFLDFYVARRVPQVPALFRAIAGVVVSTATGAEGVTLPPDRFDDAPGYRAALARYRAEPGLQVLFESGFGDPDHPGSPVGTFQAEFAQWPPARTVATPWYFQPDGRLRTTPPSIPAGDARGASSYEYDPTAKPATNFPGGGNIWGTDPTYDWRPLPLGKALAFDSPRLQRDTVMVGTGSVDLWLRSSAPDVDLEVTLTELRPDGQERYVQNGWLRASHRALDPARSTVLRPWATHLEADAADLRTGRFERVRVELFPFAHVFRAGSRIRLAVEAPGGNRAVWIFDSIPADGTVVNEIAHSVGRASRVVLPVIPGVDAPATRPPCPSLRGQPCRPTYGNAAPIGVAARRLANRTVLVAWEAPPTVRPGDTITSYRVRDLMTGRVAAVAPDARSVRFTGAAAGEHAYAVEARYGPDQGSGWSTPSSTIVVDAG